MDLGASPEGNNTLREWLPATRYFGQDEQTSGTLTNSNEDENLGKSIELHQSYAVAMGNDKRLAYVVDDEETIAKTLALILNASGFEAVAFTEPLKALRAAAVRCPDFLNHRRVDAIIERHRARHPVQGYLSRV